MWVRRKMKLKKNVSVPTLFQIFSLLLMMEQMKKNFFLSKSWKTTTTTNLSFVHKYLRELVSNSNLHFSLSTDDFNSFDSEKRVIGITRRIKSD